MGKQTLLPVITKKEVAMTTAGIEITKLSRRPKYQIVQLYFCIKQLMRGAITTSKCSELIQSPEDYVKRLIKTVEVM